MEGRDNPNEQMEDKKTEKEMRKILAELKPSKAGGPENMHPCFSWESAHELARPLSIIVNKSLETSEVPHDYIKREDYSTVQKRE